jgi:radical SAM superfamily enzyme YgiQ (UPF0313 family)
MKVLLIYPPAHSKVGLHTFLFVEPLGLEAVAASLVGKHEVEILDARLEPNIRRKLSSFKPDAVGVAASFTSTVYSAYKVLDMVRDYDPRIHTFVGGYHATLCHSDFAGRAEAAVIGEGELTAPELLHFWEQDKPLDGLQGIAFQHRECWRENEPRPLIQHLDDAPLPARHLVEKYRDRYFVGGWRPSNWVETSRGCQYHCKFCAVWRFHRGHIRMRSPQTVVQELRNIESPYISFADDNFLVSTSRAREICQGIREAGIKKNYQIQARSDTIVKHPDLLKEWADIGLKTVFIGFESFTQEGLEALQKQNSVQSNEGAIRIMRKLGIGVMSSFIVNPDYNERDFAAFREYLKHKKPPLPVFWVLTPIPGTVMYEERRQELISENYELFDGLHSVLPTRLRLKKFYRQYFRLYMSAHLGRVLSVFVPRKKPIGGHLSLLAFFRNVVLVLGLIKDANPRALWRDHFESPRKPPGKKPGLEVMEKSGSKIGDMIG